MIYLYEKAQTMSLMLILPPGGAFLVARAYQTKSL